MVCQSLVNVALFNACSVNNKALLLSDIIVDRKLDLLFINETWHKQNDGLLFNQITPEGYGLFDLPQGALVEVGELLWFTICNLTSALCAYHSLHHWNALF